MVYYLRLIIAAIVMGTLTWTAFMLIGDKSIGYIFGIGAFVFILVGTSIIKFVVKKHYQKVRAELGLTEDILIDEHAIKVTNNNVIDGWLCLTPNSIILITSQAYKEVIKLEHVMEVTYASKLIRRYEGIEIKFLDGTKVSFTVEKHKIWIEKINGLVNERKL